MNARELHNLRLQVELELRSIQKRLHDLAVRDYPSTVGPDLISELSAVVRDHGHEIQRISEDYALDPLGASSTLRSEHRKLMVLLSFLDFIANAETRNVPWSLVRSVERMSEALQPDRKLLITSPIQSPTYAIHWWKSYGILEVPAVHRLNALFHVLVGHEIFHPLVESHLEDVYYSQVANRVKDECFRYLKSVSSGELGPLFLISKLTELMEYVREVWRKAMKEIMCDMGCVALFGPAGLLATARYALPYDPDEVPQIENGFYPPWRYRIRAAREYAFLDPASHACFDDLQARMAAKADLADCASRLNDELRRLQDFCEDKSDIRSIETHPLVKIAYDQVSLELQNGWSLVNSIVQAGNVHWQSFYKEVPDHVRNLRLRVPSCEVRKDGELIGRPAALSAVVIAGWLVDLGEQALREEKSIEESVERYLTHCRLIFKSCEDAETKRVFDSEFDS